MIVSTIRTTTRIRKQAEARPVAQPVNWHRSRKNVRFSRQIQRNPRPNLDTSASMTTIEMSLVKGRWSQVHDDPSRLFEKTKKKINRSPRNSRATSGVNRPRISSVATRDPIHARTLADRRAAETTTTTGPTAMATVTRRNYRDRMIFGKVDTRPSRVNCRKPDVIVIEAEMIVMTKTSARILWTVINSFENDNRFLNNHR